MRVVGKQTSDIALSGEASGNLLKRAAAFNESLQAFFPSGKAGYIPKGLYRFKTHAEANNHQDICLAMHIARMSVKAQRSDG